MPSRTFCKDRPVLEEDFEHQGGGSYPFNEGFKIGGRTSQNPLQNTRRPDESVNVVMCEHAAHTILAVFGDPHMGGMFHGLIRWQFPRLDPLSQNTA